MGSQEFYNRRMSEISQPIDTENDPFSNLFVSEKKSKEMDLSDMRPPPERETHDAHYGSHSEPIEQKYSRSLGQQNKVSVSVYLFLSIASVAVVLAFLVGFFGGTFLLGKLADGGVEIATVPNDVPNAMALSQKPDTKTIPQISAGTFVSPEPPVAQQVSRQQISQAVKKPETQIAFATDVQSTDSQSQVTRLLRDGHLLEQANDYNGARAKFRQAFAAGSNIAALAIARTYDGRRANLADGVGDVKLAREWYEKWFLAGLAKGDISSRARYDRLLSGLKEN